jgi:DNA-binding response OmpR family regulator
MVVGQRDVLTSTDMAALTQPLRPEPATSGARALREVLIVEDDGPIRQTLVAVLEHAGYAVRQASDGLDALELLEDQAPDAIVLDLTLPRLSRWQFLERARPVLERSGVPVLILSALDPQSRALEATGAAAWLTKPVETDQLLAAIDALIRVRAPRVLVIDDERIIRELLVEHIADDGYAVDSAQTIIEARARMRVARPDLIVLDLMLPDQTGWDFLRERLLDPLLSAIPVVVISAATRERLELASQLGANALLSKPFDLSDVTALVRSYVAS